MGIRVAGLDAKRDADALIGQSGGNGDFSVMDAGHGTHGAHGFHSAPDLIRHALRARRQMRLRILSQRSDPLRKRENLGHESRLRAERPFATD